VTLIFYWPKNKISGQPVAKTRNGKLVALAWKQSLQEKLDTDSEESDLHALNIICDRQGQWWLLCWFYGWRR
jgi:hypothetical protein